MESYKTFATFSALSFLLLLSSFACCEAQLSSTFYNVKCPNALSTIQNVIRIAVSKERRMAASLIRLHFHDCFVQGCDGSVLLDQSATIQSEKNARANSGSIRGFNVIEAAKAAVEKICPGIVSCADIVAVAARDSSVLVGGPSWPVMLGRRDSTTANFAQASSDLPSPFMDLPALIANFANKGLSPREMVALSGSHTVGLARCLTFRPRIYSNASNIDPGFASTRRRGCPATGGDNNLAPLDLVTPGSFDSNYFKALIQKKGLLTSDQVLFNGGSTDAIVTQYSNDYKTFANDFAAAMVKMGNLSPLTGQNGIIRKVCNAV